MVSCRRALRGSLRIITWNDRGWITRNREITELRYVCGGLHVSFYYLFLRRCFPRAFHCNKSNMRIVFILLIINTTHLRSDGQVLISLLLGDKLNTGKIEFGLDGGLSLSNLHGVSPSSTKPGFNLGFYFDFRLKNPAWALHTGVMVKSTLGAEDIPIYSLNDQDLDNAFSGGSVVRKLGYFNVPAMIKYKWKNNLFAEIGPMISLMNNATDEFVATVEKKDDLTDKLKIKDP